MSDENTHAVPDDGPESEQRRNFTQNATENSANPEIAPAESHKRKRDYLPKTPQECARSKILKSGSTPLRERFMADMQYNSLSKTTQKNYLNAVLILSPTTTSLRKRLQMRKFASNSTMRSTFAI